MAKKNVVVLGSTGSIGVNTLDVVRRNPPRVEAHRVVPPPGCIPMEDYISPLDFKIAAGPAGVPADMAKELATTLLSTDTYSWGSDKACGYPVYGVKLSFFRGSERVDVYFCFKCSVLAVVRDEQVVGRADFDHGERVLIDLVKKLFPQDAEIQAIRQ